MRRVLTLSVLVLLLAPCAGARAEGDTVQTTATGAGAEVVKTLHPSTLTLADELVLTVRTRVRPGWVLIDPEPLEVRTAGADEAGALSVWTERGLEVVGVRRSPPKLHEGDGGAWIVVERELTFEPPMPGEHTTPELSFVLTSPEGDQETLTAGPLAFTVRSVLDDGGERAELEVGEHRGVAPWEAPPPFPWVRAMAYALAGVLVLLAASIVAIVLLTRRTSRSVLDRLPSQIDRLRKKANDAGDSIPALSRVWDDASDLFARCVGERLEPGASMLEHEEMVRRSSGWFGLSAGDRDRLADLLREIDRVRYAGEKATRKRTLSMLDDLEAVLGRVKAASDMVVTEMQSAGQNAEARA